MAEIRKVVMARADGRCEWCSRANMTLELHHVLSGGKRRSDEAFNTCAAICWDCHRAVHRNDEGVLAQAATWASAHGYGDALREVERRMRKVETLKVVVR